jgi:mannitol-1-phosphate/altronate dehydrogenase
MAEVNSLASAVELIRGLGLFGTYLALLILTYKGVIRFGPHVDKHNEERREAYDKRLQELREEVDKKEEELDAQEVEIRKLWADKLDDAKQTQRVAEAYLALRRREDGPGDA